MDKSNLTNNTQQENYRTEYKEVSSVYRFYMSLRFIIAAFMGTMESAIFTLYYQSLKDDAIKQGAVFLPTLGMIVATVVLFTDWRTRVLIESIIERGREIEFQLGIQGYFGRLIIIPLDIDISSVVRLPERIKIYTERIPYGIPLIYLTVYMVWSLIVVTEILESILQFVKKGG